ncbi:MAG: hypothetical protein QOF13_2042 [Solirubrobacterales bacterium]|jgi:hypothetical protein|nr:hypothetical protein [Solirubrobacterales bacterium]
MGARDTRPERIDPSPQVNPLNTIDALVGRFTGWTRRVGEVRVAYAVLGLTFAVAAVLILAWGTGQTFINDEWNYLVVYRGFALETLFAPQNGHLVVLPRLIYKGMFATVGTSSHFPYQVMTVLLHLIVAAIFFQLVRRRLQLAVAVALTMLVALFGVCWDTLMGAYELPNLTGMAGGLGMLLALQRRSRGGDIAACLLLAVSLASFSVGIAFALGALLSIWLGGRTQWRRAWVVLGPAALYAAWFIWARKFGQSEVSAESVSAVLSGSADQLAAICAAITGLFRVPGSIGLPVVLEIRPDWGYPLALVFSGLIALYVRRAPRSIYFWTVLATLVIYLALVAAGLSPARAPNSGRYVYLGGILTLLLVAELAREIEWSTAVGVVAFVLFGFSLMANVADFRAGGQLFRAEGETNRATLAALELSRGHVDRFRVVEDEKTAHSHADMLFPVWAYYEAAEKFGSPAYSLAQLEATGEQAREAADEQLVRDYEIAAASVASPRFDRGGPAPKLLAATGGMSRPAQSCLRLISDRGKAGSFQIELPPGGFSYKTAPGAEVELKVARFGELFATALPPTTGSAEVSIPTDASDVPWRAELDTAAKTIVCPR